MFLKTYILYKLRKWLFDGGGREKLMLYTQRQSLCFF